MFMGLMAIPNIIALFLLSREVQEILEDYDLCLKNGKVYWEYEYENIDERKRKRKPVLRKGWTTSILK